MDYVLWRYEFTMFIVEAFKTNTFFLWRQLFLSKLIALWLYYQKNTVFFHCCCRNTEFIWGWNSPLWQRKNIWIVSSCSASLKSRSCFGFITRRPQSSSTCTFFCTHNKACSLTLILKTVVPLFCILYFNVHAFSKKWIFSDNNIDGLIYAIRGTDRLISPQMRWMPPWHCLQLWQILQS